MLNAQIFCKALFRQLFSGYMYIGKAAEMKCVQKICTFNVDEIDTYLAFDQLNYHIKID